MRRMSFVQAKAQISELVDQAEQKHQPVLILRHGTPAAAILKDLRRRLARKPEPELGDEDFEAATAEATVVEQQEAEAREEHADRVAQRLTDKGKDDLPIRMIDAMREGYEGGTKATRTSPTTSALPWRYPPASA